MIVRLNDAEQRLARYMAKRRQAANRSACVTDAKIGPQSCDEIDLEGAATELAFAKITNTYPDLEIGSYGDGDCYTVAQGAIDVKSTKYRNGKLLARISKKGHPPDAYALMIGEFPNYKFVGWVDAADLLHTDNITNLGHGATYALEQSQLAQAL